MSASRNNQNGITFVGALGLLFIGLKLGHVITWSWWWVTAPLWGGAALVVAVLVSFALCAGLVALVRAATRRRVLKAARRRPAVSRRVSISERKDQR